ncbi:MAG: hypothetical protein PHF58_13870 [Methylotenera sp.]|nr:hypothetical protein [Methylotenera sp.]
MITTLPLDSENAARNFDSLSNVFGKDYAEFFHDPVIFIEVHLSAPPTMAMFRRDFKLMSRALYLESVYRRYDNYNQTLLDNFGKMVNEKLALISRLYETRRNQLLKIIHDNGAEPSRTYLHPTALYVPIIAAPANSFMQLLVRLDEYYNLTGFAYLRGLMDSSQRQTAELELRRAARSFLALVRNEQIKLRKESLRLRALREEPGRGNVPAAPNEVTIAEGLIDASQKEFEASDDPKGEVSLDQSQAVFDAVVSNGIASAKASTRHKPKLAEPAETTVVTPA